MRNDLKFYKTGLSSWKIFNNSVVYFINIGAVDEICKHAVGQIGLQRGCTDMEISQHFIPNNAHPPNYVERGTR